MMAAGGGGAGGEASADGDGIRDGGDTGDGIGGGVALPAGGPTGTTDAGKGNSAAPASRRGAIVLTAPPARMNIRATVPRDNIQNISSSMTIASS